MMRLSAHDKNTCLACLSQDGEIIPIDEEMYDHVCGRCTAVPVCDGVEPPEWEKGADWFEGLSGDTQEEMMGGERYAAWKDGQFAFKDSAIVTDDPTWGKGLQVAPLSALTGA
jgi:hypothetical protein